MILFKKVMFSRLWHELMAMVKIYCKPKNNLIYYLIIFASGVICSCIVFSILSNKENAIKNPRHPMTLDNFLQVRDEFSVLSPYYDGMDSGGGVHRVKKSKSSRGKSKPEGMT